MRLGALEELAVGRDNNFNLLRMLAATGVLVSHAYPITLGPGALQPFQAALGGVTLGSICVYVFFAISGFFIAQSFDRTRSRMDFLRARALRLFPALLVVLLVTVIVAGLWLTTALPGAYWAAVPEYMIRNLTLFKLQFVLPGVFEAVPYGPPINGSLWTLNYEVLCYAGVFLIGVLGLLRKPGVMAAVMAAIVLAYAVVMMAQPHPRLISLADLGLPFAIGTALYVWRSWIVLDLRVALGLGLATLALRLGGGDQVWAMTLFKPVFVLWLSYTIFLAGYWRTPMLLAYNRLGDYSYGIYIYAFPLQQLMAHLGLQTPMANMAAAFAATLLCAVLSWHLVEGPALKLKRRRPATDLAEARR